jgi:hypothetical protein
MKELKMTSEKIATIERFDPTTLISGKLDWMPEDTDWMNMKWEC